TGFVRHVCEFWACSSSWKADHVDAILDAERESVKWQGIALANPVIQGTGCSRRLAGIDGRYPDTGLVRVLQACKYMIHGI
ncbi:MAG TPA: hypothetical protein VHE81_23175, partial [Lacipirellulaceae bacterium]|nr:hypothetical protein [Lacipirellulaceae bacterium]